MPFGLLLVRLPRRVKLSPPSSVPVMRKACLRPLVAIVQNLRVVAADAPGGVQVWIGGSSLAVFPRATSDHVQPSPVRVAIRLVQSLVIVTPVAGSPGSAAACCGAA
jgi:hypothetical protein